MNIDKDLSFQWEPSSSHKSDSFASKETLSFFSVYRSLNLAQCDSHAIPDLSRRNLLDAKRYGSSTAGAVITCRRISEEEIISCSLAAKTTVRLSFTLMMRRKSQGIPVFSLIFG